ncbi:pyridoxal-phosphate dependent enzyme [Arenibacter sp. GZD96]|uniref:1-aminocyclopropane-1-carboxylate deaminase/D-cysteine desulfhydrase n=1 Tax=Aurantibrevibacter litoralis TaxID=3106030 RepID=UPI002B0009A5|nr:pyridoxal-phosphate dependent enzyme [Arenibacter sp. GZD-96]MEA1785790.1 pyridoxal-phosphate dependent enzyme [Arenibacter sp. GZD-96]
MKSNNQHIVLPLLEDHKVSLFIKREDRNHPVISGNKYHKLKYNIKEAENLGYSTLLTFGGAYSNHIIATACAGHEHGLRTVGVIRGEELAVKWQDNPTLVKAKAYGMVFKFVSRAQYAHKESPDFHSYLYQEFGSFYLLPEGGTNALAVKGCEEILVPEDADFDFICCAVGTGGTMAGIINAAKAHQHILGFPALKGDFLQKDICNFAVKKNWSLQTKYHFGGYAKVSQELIAFINSFREGTGIPLEPIYTGKMMYGIVDLIKKKRFPSGAKILAIHSGGLQGVAGINKVLKTKKLPLLHV